MDFHRPHPNHQGPNLDHLTHVYLAREITAAQPRKVLDIPCGTGCLSNLLLQGGIDVVSSDIAPKNFIIPGRVAIAGDLNSILPFNENSFDGFVCNEGIEHIENPHLLVREANRVLKMKGKLFLSTPNVLSIRSRMSFLLRGYPNQFHYMIEINESTGREQPIAHINPIGFLELRYVLSRWGFRIDFVDTQRVFKRYSPLYQFVRLLKLMRGKKSASTNPGLFAVRKMLLSKEVLFGDTLIMGATKVKQFTEC